MPAVSVLRLEDYRDRRAARLRLAHALHRGDPRRHAVFNHLVEVSELTGADRVAAVWVDEHGTGLIHPYLVVDHLSDRPRRMFAPEPLRGAWQLGVPGAYDSPTATPATFAVALGSDGTRAWFLVADSVMPRPAVDADTRDRIMFLAGECAAVVLHRDLDLPRSLDTDAVGGSRFAGWDVLEDLEGRESDEAESRRIAQRFVVARLVRMLVDDDLTVSRERTVEQVRRARAELAANPSAEGEGEILSRALAALEDERLDDLATTLVELGDASEARGHWNGALELYKCAYEVATGVGIAKPAIDAARLAGRLVRRRAKWSEADHWFRLTQEIAEAAGMDDMVARALVGLAGIKKDTGNLPAARENLRAALAAAEDSGDRGTLALVHHGLLGVEQAAGDLAAGLQHGWVAVAMYEDAEARIRCLASLAGALADFGDRDAAKDAWTVVAHSSNERYYRVYAHDALAYLAALRGDADAFEDERATCDRLGWERESPAAKAEILFYRGLSYRELGQLDLAREWLVRAVTFAEENQYNQVLFRAEDALRTLSERSKEAVTRPAPTAPPDVREGLRTMRQELVGSVL